MRIAMVGACPFPVPQGSQTLLAQTARGVQALGCPHAAQSPRQGQFASQKHARYAYCKADGPA